MSRLGVFVLLVYEAELKIAVLVYYSQEGDAPWNTIGDCLRP